MSEDHPDGRFFKPAAQPERSEGREGGGARGGDNFWAGIKPIEVKALVEHHRGARGGDDAGPEFPVAEFPYLGKLRAKVWVRCFEVRWFGARCLIAEDEEGGVWILAPLSRVVPRGS